MIIKYKFSTGEVTEVEVSDEIGTVILDSRREEHANNERHRYHTAFSLDDMTYEDKDYFSADDNPEKALMRKESAKQRSGLHHGRNVCRIGQEAQQPGGIQGYLPQGTDFPAGGDCPHPGRAGHWNGFCTSHGSDLLLSVQRGREHY